MDVAGISSVYDSLYSSGAYEAKQVQFTNLQNASKDENFDKELMDASKEFEAYFLEQMMKEMVKTIPTESLMGSSSTLMDFYKDEMIKEMAKVSTDINSLGLAQTLYEQMRRNYGIEQVISATDIVENEPDRDTKGVEGASVAGTSVQGGNVSGQSV
ncbi:MAG: rod-binding protein [Lachnospiraceae bacterium]|nr:rod-binding protein [Lachnospiraceae bacterium]